MIGGVSLDWIMLALFLGGPTLAAIVIAVVGEVSARRHPPVTPRPEAFDRDDTRSLPTFRGEPL